MFVSRARYEAMERRAIESEARGDRAEERADHWGRKYVELVQQMADMKQVGFVTRAQSVTQSAPSLPPEIEKAIAEKAGRNPSLRSYLRQYATQAARDGIEAARIIHDITHGEGAPIG